MINPAFTRVPSYFTPTDVWNSVGFVQKIHGYKTTDKLYKLRITKK